MTTIGDSPISLSRGLQGVPRPAEAFLGNSDPFNATHTTLWRARCRRVARDGGQPAPARLANLHTRDGTTPATTAKKCPHQGPEEQEHEHFAVSVYYRKHSTVNMETDRKPVAN